MGQAAMPGMIPAMVKKSATIVLRKSAPAFVMHNTEIVRVHRCVVEPNQLSTVKCATRRAAR